MADNEVVPLTEAEGLLCYLDTVQLRNVPIYQKLGFRVLVETVDRESGLRLWTFRRDPPQASAAGERTD